MQPRETNTADPAGEVNRIDVGGIKLTVITCPHCQLNQFPICSGNCRRCNKPMAKEQPEDLIAKRILGELTENELIVLYLVSDGHRNRMIGEIMGTTEQVTKNRVREVFNKTGMDTRLELAIFATMHPQLLEEGKECLKQRYNPQ
jgi:DNA-binding CsgD family transcriptional regulator